jgi:iron complex transport system substrate-binding protein
MANTRSAMPSVDLEAIVKWDPEVIVASVNETADDLLNDPALATVSAVKNKRVFKCPQGIFLWSARSGEGALMALWLGVTLYPDLFVDIDIRAEVKSFFLDYYNYRLTESETDDVLAGRYKIF